MFWVFLSLYLALEGEWFGGFLNFVVDSYDFGEIFLVVCVGEES